MIIMDFRDEDLLKAIPGFVNSPTRDIPIRFAMAGLEMLTDAEAEFPRSTLDMSVLAFASGGVSALRQVKQLGVYGLELDEHAQALLFKMDQDTVLVHSTYTDVTVEVRYDLLLETWLRFADRVRGFVTQHFPEFENNPKWSSWLRGVEDLPHGPDASWQTYYEACKEGLEHLDAVEE